ncbi:MAG TPA: C39 family peptidase [Fimbriimonas sp.]|nr:C39 family peptidase [Fimbriimonas sp.]
MVSMIVAAVVAPVSARLVRVPVTLSSTNGQAVSKEYPNISPGMEFNEVIPSWNLENAGNGSVRVELRVHTPAGKSKWFRMADWSGDNTWQPRQSTDDQKDDDGNVLTDTLRTPVLRSKVDLKVTLVSKPDKSTKVKLLTLCFSNTKLVAEQASWPTRKLGVVSDVPERAQNNYPNGGVLCSATSTSMMLWHYSKLLNRPELDRDVPEVEKAVWDPVYKGAGNWPFNTAFFGSFPGLRACVSRFTSISDVEALTEAGIPVVCSVSLDLLQGKPKAGGGGHLVIVVGFRPDGTPVINDPAFKAGVRKTYKRADFEKAWCFSKRTVYLMLPDSKKLPKDPLKLWSFR